VGTTSFPFQKPKPQCALKAFMAQSIPLYVKWGTLHFISSTTSGHAAWTTSRMCVRIGWANSAEFAM